MITRLSNLPHFNFMFDVTDEEFKTLVALSNCYESPDILITKTIKHFHSEDKQDCTIIISESVLCEYLEAVATDSSYESWEDNNYRVIVPPCIGGNLAVKLTELAEMYE